ncbi:MAG: bifunctional pyr operon transcriptional regulator/uracil phosphoribosyltransferase PyrR [Planctomycetota bacterium]
MAETRQLFDGTWIGRAINRIAQQIVELNAGADELVIVGLHTHGVFLARRIAAAIRDLEGVDVPVGTMDITLYRDDVGIRLRGPHLPQREGTNIPVDISEKVVILADDVLNTGRSIRAALDQLMDLGRARKIQLVGLIDRGGRELPIRPDFVGRKVTIAEDENIRVQLTEQDDVDAVLVVPKEQPAKPQG